MGYFNDEETKNINQMWINVRCFNLKDVPLAIWGVLGAVAACIAVLAVKHRYFS